MKLLFHVISIALIISGAIVSAAAQGPPAPPPAAKPTKTVGHAKIFYLSRVNKTTVESDFLRRDKTSFKAWFEIPGQKVSPPRFIQIFFQCFSPGLKYKEDHALTISIESSQLPLGDARILMSSCDPKGSGECYELLLSPHIPYEDFLRMLKAKAVSLKLGPTTWELKPEEIEKLNDLEKSIER